MVGFVVQSVVECGVLACQCLREGVWRWSDLREGRRAGIGGVFVLPPETRHLDGDVTVGQLEGDGITVEVHVAASGLADEDGLGDILKAIGEVLRGGEGRWPDEDEEMSSAIEARARDGNQERAEVGVVAPTVAAKVDNKTVVIMNADEMFEAGRELAHRLAGWRIDGVELQVDRMRCRDLGEGNIFRPGISEWLLAALADCVEPTLAEGIEIVSVDGGFECDDEAAAVLVERIGGFVR